jgi:hypothetical protein
MNVIPLFKDENKLRDEIRNIQIQIPSEWWSSSYTVNFSEINNSPTMKYVEKTIKTLPKIADWDIQKGDYRVKETKANTRDFVYYRDMKIKILKYALYPVIFATVLLVIKISSLLSNI